MAVSYKYTQSETADAIAEEAECSRAEVKRFLDATFAVVATALQNGERIEIAGVVVEPKLRPASKKRQGRNPATGEEITIAAKPESVVVKARVTAKLKPYAPTKAKLKAALL
jgi:DNA-binding protein HU-beta